MAGHWVSEPYECRRECRDSAAGPVWFQAICRDWLEDGATEPEVKIIDWIDTGEPCIPGEPGA